MELEGIFECLPIEGDKWVIVLDGDPVGPPVYYSEAQTILHWLLRVQRADAH